HRGGGERRRHLARDRAQRRMNSLLLATPSERFEQRVYKVLFGALGNTVAEQRDWRGGLLEDNPAQVVHELTRSTPEVIAIGPGFDIDKALDVAAEIDAHRPDVGRVLLAEPSPDLLEHALRIGAREVVSPDATDDVLRDAFLRAFETAGRRRTTLARVEAPQHRNGHTDVAPQGG